MRCSSTTSSRTSRSSSTSDREPGVRGAPTVSPASRLGGLVRLVHPFPSLLDAAVTLIVATIAGADAPRVAVLAMSMLLLQFGIGAANDWADAPADGAARPDKPIPAGRVSRGLAARVAVAAAGSGLMLAALAGPAALGVACAGLLTGLAYDLRLKGTPWSWMPYAVGIPLLLLFGWVGATGEVPPALGVVLPVAMAAGAALAIANALADVERDEAAGVETVATAAGIVVARRVGALLQAAVGVAALASVALLGGSPAGIAVAAVGTGIVALGVGLGWGSGRIARQRAWEVQAVGLAVVAAGWVAALASTGRLAG